MNLDEMKRELKERYEKHRNEELEEKTFEWYIEIISGGKVRAKNREEAEKRALSQLKQQVKEQIEDIEKGEAEIPLWETEEKERAEETIEELRREMGNLGNPSSDPLVTGEYLIRKGAECVSLEELKRYAVEAFLVGRPDLRELIERETSDVVDECSTYFPDVDRVGECVSEKMRKLEDEIKRSI